jgi:PAS domain S-box-containing protein
MTELSPVAVGIVLLFLGIALTLLTLGITRLLPRLQPASASPPPPVSPKVAQHNEAVLLVQSGGRIVYMNRPARELFNVWEDEPNLESLARRTRPSETFLMLCASEGQARFSLNGRFVEGTSYYTPGSIGSGPEYTSAILVSLRRPQLILDVSNPRDENSESSRPPATKAKDDASQIVDQPGGGGSYNANAHIAEVPSQAFSIFFELTQAMAASLDLETTLQSVLESVDRLFPSDFLEITLWDAEARHLTPYRLVGLAGIDRHLEKAPERYRPDEGYSGFLITHHQALLVKDVNTFRLVRPALDRQRYPFQSYIGTPLLLAGDLIGTLELASLAKENYTESDLEALRLLASQAVVAVNNAVLYQKELQRSLEMSGLANLAQSASLVSDPQELYSHLIDSISRLLDVEILGFLIYNDNRGILEGQTPFIGLPPSILEWCQAPIPPDSPAESIWKAGETIVATHAPADERIQAYQLHHLAQAAGIRHTALIPLTTSGRPLGYLWVANKRDGTPFDGRDLRFLAILAGQAAPMIENLALIQQSRRRAQRAETLRRIASLTSSAATLEEILRFSLLDLARLLQVDAAAIFLVDEGRGEMRLHRGSMFGIPPEISNRLGRIPTEGPQFAQTVAGRKQPLISSDASKFGPAGAEPGEDQTMDTLADGEQTASLDAADCQAMAIYRPLIEGLKIRSVVSVPLIVREQGIGELFVGCFRPDFFTSGDVQTISTASGQIAGAIERETLYSQTDNSLRQRIEQLVALTRVSRELNTTVKLEDLLQRVYSEALRATQADCGSIVLFELNSDLKDQPGGLASATGAVAAKGINGEHPATDHEPAIIFHYGDESGARLHPLEKSVLLQGDALIIADFEQAGDEIQQLSGSGQEVAPAHEGVRSALVVPIAYQGQVAGLLHLHSKSPRHFNTAEREVGEALAIQAAIALGNARRFQEQVRRSQELNQRVETLSKIFEVTQVIQSEQPLEQSLEAIAYAIQTATPFERVLISIYDPEQKHLVRIAGAGIPLFEMAELHAHPAPWSSMQTLMEERFSLGRSYFIPAEHSDAVPADLVTYPPRSDAPLDAAALGVDETPSKGLRWHPDDLWIMPLYGSDHQPLGLISVDAPRNNLRPDRPTIEAVEIFGSQASLIIENQLKVQNLRFEVEKIEQELALAGKIAQKAQSHLPVLLHKDLEQTLAIQNLGQRARRIHAGLDITEIIRKKSSRDEVLLALGQETLARMDFDTVLIAETSEGGIDLACTLGSIPGEVNPKALLGQRNPLRQCLQSGEIIMVSNLSENEDWQNTAFLRALEARSFLCLPIQGETNGHATETTASRTEKKNGKDQEQKRISAAMLAIGRNPVAPFTGQDEQLFDLLTRQVTIALQNLSLMEETSRRLKEVNLLLDFSRQLGSLDPANILNALVDSALHVVPGAQSAMAALWDSHQGVLVPQACSGFADAQELLKVRYRPGEGLAGQVFEQKRAMNVEEVDFARHYNLPADELLHFRNATGGRLPVSSLAVPIQAGSLQDESSQPSMVDSQISQARVNPLGVLILDSTQATSAFTENELALVRSLAQQTALTLENARLYQASRQRSNQLQQLTNVTTTITSSLQTDDLIDTLLDQLQAILPYDTGTLWLREKGDDLASAKGRQDRMVIRAARGFADSDQRIGLKVDIQDSALLNEMINTGLSIWVADVREDPRFQALAFSDEFVGDASDADQAAEAENIARDLGAGYEYLSWLGVPLIVTGEVIGVIALEKAEAGYYSQDDIQIASTFAGQAAVGLENARLYQESVQRAMELDQRTATLSILNRLSHELSGTLDAAHILDFAVQEFMQIMNCTSASALVLDRSTADRAGGGRIILQAEYPYFEGDSPYFPGMPMPEAPIFKRLQETQGIFNTGDVELEPDLEPLNGYLRHHNTRSLLIVPIISGSASGIEPAERHFRGMLLAHNAADSHGAGEVHRFSSEEIELARTISNQVAIALQNAQLLEETMSLTEDLELRVQQRTAEVARERQRAETLLRIITELSASLDLDQVLQRTLHVLGEFVDAVQITILIVRPGEKKLKRLASIGYAPVSEDQNKDTPLDIDQGLAGWIISQHQSVLIGDVLEDERWVQILYPNEAWKPAFRHRSAMGVPLSSGAEALGCLLLFHPEVDHFSMDQLDLVQAAANQVAVAVNNAELYRLIRDQAEDLGNLLRNQQIETSRSKAILEAVADGVLVTDAHRIITLFNESAEKILGLAREDVLGKSMEHFSGLFGRGTRRWMETIETWSRQPDNYQSGELFAEQITLEDGRVISVRLAPVSLRNDFLGTVSIFQDITHQVEVDRLKSEFVATVSHELRTPMTSIKGYVEVLLMGAAGPLTEQQTRFLQVVKANTERLAVLVNDLLDVSQIESGKATISVQPVNLDDIADQAIAELKQRIAGSDKGVRIEKETQPNLPRALADPDRIRRVLDNLLDNAFQYNLPDGRILVRLSQVGEEVQVDVQDSGVGIPHEDQERVFERFFRGETPLNLGVAGTGLGLSIVQNLVRMQNGRIWLESTGIPGDGSTFSFTLPVYVPG